MRFMYDIFFIVFCIFYMPYLVLMRKYHSGFPQRFGFFSADFMEKARRIAPGRPVWLHAVSVGEMKATESFIAGMRSAFPSKKFVISNVTKAGHDIALNVARSDDMVIYLPLDLSFIVRKFVKLLKPSIFITVETEIWPNIITELYSEGVPVVVVNGRLSQRSCKRYVLIRRVMKGVLTKISLFCMGSQDDAERIKRLGAPADRVVVTGNMKFDNVAVAEGCTEKRPFWLKEGSELIVAGSTHRGEDAKIISSYKALRSEFPALELLIAPRHTGRVSEIVRLVSKAGYLPVLFSEAEKVKAGGQNQVFILDSMGKLNSLYAVAAAVFMGGSLVPHGGHNFIEPAASSRPIVTGPHVHNFRDIFELFAKHDAIETAASQDELIRSFRRILSDKNGSRSMGERARNVVLENIGSTAKNISLIRQFL